MLDSERKDKAKRWHSKTICIFYVKISMPLSTRKYDGYDAESGNLGNISIILIIHKAVCHSALAVDTRLTL
jgi:hypothetical protein